jgi:hypothetical protein
MVYKRRKRMLARRQAFDEMLFVIEKGGVKAAQCLVDQIDEDTLASIKRSRVLIDGAKAIIDRAFKAQTMFAMYTEGFATPDLVDAATLLDLSSI